jgi:hypothetical protein
MDTGALKKFAQAARNLLIDQVTAKLRRRRPGLIRPAREPRGDEGLDAAIARSAKPRSSNRSPTPGSTASPRSASWT